MSTVMDVPRVEMLGYHPHCTSQWNAVRPPQTSLNLLGSDGNPVMRQEQK